MKRSVKPRDLKIRLRRKDRNVLEKAARIETARRGIEVGESTLLRELAMPRVREIVEQAKAAA